MAHGLQVRVSGGVFIAAEQIIDRTVVMIGKGQQIRRFHVPGRALPGFDDLAVHAQGIGKHLLRLSPLLANCLNAAADRLLDCVPLHPSSSFYMVFCTFFAGRLQID